MRSRVPKVLHELAGKSMIERVLDMLARAGIERPIVVVGYGADAIRERVGNRCLCVDQEEQRGTGHAARVGIDALPRGTRRVLIVHGDEPLLPALYLETMLDLQSKTGASVVLLTTHVEDTRSFGRVVRNALSMPIGLPQQADLTPEQRLLDEVNLGAYVFDVAFLQDQAVRFEPHPPKGEYYLTDIVEMAARIGARVEALTVRDGAEIMGINDRVQLEESTRALYRRTNCRLMESGVSIVNSASTFIYEDVEIAPDSIIHPFTTIRGRSVIGDSCVIGPGAHILSSQIGSRSEIFLSTVRDSVVGEDVRIGPYAHLREGACVASGVEIGTGSEIKRSSVGSGSKMHHFGYIGNARIGENVNIGAGVVTCNFNGREKHETVVEDDVFLGSDTMLRAPLVVGKGASTGAGTVVLNDVPPGVTVAGIPARIIQEEPPGTGGSQADMQDSEAETRSTA